MLWYVVKTGSYDTVQYSDIIWVDVNAFNYLSFHRYISIGPEKNPAFVVVFSF